MKKTYLFRVLLLGLILSLGFASCSDKDDEDYYIVEQSVIETAKRLNDNIASIQQVVVSSVNGDEINAIVKEKGFSNVSFSSGATAKLFEGKVNNKIPALGVEIDNETYYWTISLNGNKDWLKENGKKIPVYTTSATRMAYRHAGKNLSYPTFGLDQEGYWTLDTGAGAVTFHDASGQPVKAIADENLSLFVNIALDNSEAISLELLNKTVFEFTRTDVLFYIEQAEDKLPRFFGYSQTIEIPFEQKNITNIESKDVPAGWQIKIDEKGKKLFVTAPNGEKDEDATEAVIVIKGKDLNGIEYTATSDAYTLDYTHPNGTFVVLEGNMTSENGTLVYYDQYMRHYEDVYEKANEGELGNVLQDVYVANKKVYLLNQNGPQTNGGERFVICNARTMKKEYSHPMSFLSDDGVATWPQHLVIANNKAFIQYSTADMESHSGIRVFDLESKTIASKDVKGTYGAFTKEGALKGRMQLSRGKIYAGLGSGVVIIDPSTTTVTKTITFTSQVKGLVKGADGNIHIAVAGDFTGSPYSPTFTSDPKIVGIDHDGKELYTQLLEGAKFPIATWSPAINMAASFTNSEIYMVTSDDFSVTAASRFNYETKTLEKDLINVGETIYGYIGVHPSNETVYVPTSPGYYTRAEIFEYKVAKDNTVTKSNSYEYAKASPAGIDFGYRFSDTFINK